MTAGGVCGTHCSVRQGSSSSAVGNFEAVRHLGGGVQGACRRAESPSPASVAFGGMGQRLVAIGALLVEAVFEQMSLLIFGIGACRQKCTPRKMAIWPYEQGHSTDPYE